MRDLSVVECKMTAGAISTQDILDFFANLGKDTTPPSTFDRSKVVSDPLVGAVMGGVALVAGVLGLFGLASLFGKSGN